MSLESRIRRVGLIVPPANPAVEPEIAALLPAGLAMHATRLPVVDGDMAVRLAHYRDDYAPALKSFGNLAIDVFALGVTGASYPLGRAGDVALCESLEQACGKPVVTGSRAIADALQMLNVRALGVISPYPAWLTEQCVAFWRGAGIDVTWTHSMGETFRAYEIDPAEVASTLDAVRGKPCDAMLLTGTGLQTLAALESPAGQSAVPLLTSNLCMAWWIARALEMEMPPRLAARLPQLASGNHSKH
ncbi:MAG: hypothetical protein JNJ55_04585 [Betaproteobacteria bacterium]|nr:hypothetical protein [Betaproteobacteria bacterium]